jgi:hypothetical protein
MNFECDCNTSTGICGSTTRGTGRLDFNGYWEFPCPHGNAFSDFDRSTGDLIVPVVPVADEFLSQANERT